MKYQSIVNNKIQCEICPRKCRLKNNQRGFCYVRRNHNGQIVLDSYGYNTGLAIDPVEKKPLYHFYPNSKVLSFGTLGCNMGCLFCQNSHITKVQTPIEQCQKVSCEEIVKTAKKYNCEAIAFTYNDPIVFFEYAIDTAKLARKENIKTIAVTSGYINEEARKEFFSYMDAVNIDLKGFSEVFYNKNCLAHLKPVLDTIKYVALETNCHLELTTLIIEGENDQYLDMECDWITENIGYDIPIHFSAFFPRYKYINRLQTKFETLQKAYNLAKSKGLKYVYTGNLATITTSSTYCSNCKKELIIRNGYNIIENNLENGLCKYCKTKLYGCF
ncbi:MAG: AmmeMemoRadiSam system radical SAM enzyme [Candidatus Gastranaerophilales bacterium]|nr:AmmeMemoRadiSam system radical SAM enzyme [Candidatus Gastranaerophilales bacterium]